MGLFVIVAAIFFPGSNGPLGGSATLTYWGLFEDKSVMQSIISDFEKQNPTIKINYEKQDITQYRERLATRISNGTGPDIFKFHNTWYPMLKDYLLPIPSGTIAPDEFKTVFYPVTQKDLIKNGAIYGIPLEIDTLSLFINTQLFQSKQLNPPANWQDFITDAKALTVKEPNGRITTAGAAMGTFSNINNAPDILSLLFLQEGVNFNNLQASSPNISDALTFYTSFIKDGKVWNENLDPSQLAFAKGNLAMFFGYSTDYFAIKKFNSSLAFQVVPVPQIPEQNVTLASYWAEGASVKSKHQKEALLFLKFLAKKETEQKLFASESKQRDFGEPYARVDLADNINTNSPAYTFILQAPNATSSYFVDGTEDDGLNQELNKELEAVVGQYLDSGSNKDPGIFIKNVSATFQKYGL